MSFGLVTSKIFYCTRPYVNYGTRYYYSKLTNRYESSKYSPYLIRRALKDDHATILELMQEAYFPDEPTCLSLDIRKSKILDEDVLKDLSEGLSMVATCKYDNCIVGACINQATNPWDPDSKEDLACMLEDDKVKTLLFFYAYAQRLPDLWNCYSVQKVFEMSNLFVKKEHRRRGIALRLMQQSRALAADCGFKIVRCDASNSFTAELCQKMNMKLVTKIPYSSYITKDGEVIFKTLHPHTEYKIYIDDSPQSSPKIRV